MESKKTKYISHAIVVWSSDLKYFDEFLRKNFQNISYEAICHDETRLKPTNLNELLEYENPDFKSLASVTCKSWNEDGNNDSVEITIGKAGILFTETAMIRLNFSDVKRQMPIEDEIFKRIRSMRPWYFWLSKIPFMLLLPLLLFGYSIMLNAISLTKKLTGIIPLSASNPPSSFTENEASVFMMVACGILFLVGYLIDRFKGYLFPKYFFCLGRQEKNYEKRRTISYLIFGVIILGILINIISTIISSSLHL
jgi:hypothetical protein